ncbi:MAG: DUF3604 domain-containing protein [Proteobacteria bacterium]|jgi:hypothetical protein|nr:DUF3604 domain-containing protein [Pseudomonadota bacterium]
MKAATKEGLKGSQWLRTLHSMALCLLMGTSVTACAGEDPNWMPEVTPGSAPQSYSPNVRIGYPDQVYFGDTHVHTKLSNDAYAMGNQYLGPDEAYRFARGEVVTMDNGMKTRLRRPLDFLMVADHAVNMGVMARVAARDPLLLDTEQGRTWLSRLEDNEVDVGKALDSDFLGFRDAVMTVFYNTGGKNNLWKYFTEPRAEPEFRRSVWHDAIASAERHNEPGRFTALIGYEWSGDERGAQHRNVVFRDGADKVSQVLPFSKLDSQDPEALWAYLAEYVESTGGDAIAIPHNANISGGATFPLNDFNGVPLSREYAKTRARWEPLNEVTQYKGDGEAYPPLSPDDEFADYETWHSWAGPNTANITFDDEWYERKKGDFTRPALKRGLALKANLGTNPFKFGMIGSTDSHTSLAAAEEDNFWGTFALYEPSAFRSLLQSEFAASGYAAIWATENTREALFAAMRRKETYATTGPRMTVRFFGGWDYKDSDVFSSKLAEIGYQGGVPMGGDLSSAPQGRSPRFLIRATRDPDGANLDRVQVIKGWRSADGSLNERVYDVAVSDDREIPVEGKVAPVGSTVDTENLSYTNTIGDPELAVVWIDPNFDPGEDAFYYVRVIEIPTPRWSAYDRKFFKNEDRVGEGFPLTTQERAYTSPIWYTP